MEQLLYPFSAVYIAPPAGFKAGLQILLVIFDRLDIPVAMDKLEGSTDLPGIELDTQAMILHLPASKLDELRLLVAQWHGIKKVLCEEVSSISSM